MKRGYFIICIAFIILMMHSACSVGQVINISCDDFEQQQPRITKEVDIPRGGILTVMLCSKSQTGCRWSDIAEISDQVVLKQINHQSYSQSKNKLGELLEKLNVIKHKEGRDIWIFQVQEKGTSTILMVYNKPQETINKEVWALTVNVTVK